MEDLPALPGGHGPFSHILFENTSDSVFDIRNPRGLGKGYGKDHNPPNILAPDRRWE